MKPDRVIHVILCLLAGLLLALTTARAETAASTNASSIERGRYLVERVGMCADCHTPRNEKGAFVMEQWLMGAALPFQPMVEMPWSPVAPPIAGLPSMNEEDSVRFMMHGARPDGTRPRPPMPEFQFAEEDARAVVAYLKSLAK